MTNPEVLRLAREIAFNFHGSHPLYADALREMLKSGEWDGSSEVQIAIAAIERTSSLGALWLRTNPDAAHKPHDAFERYDHLRQPEKGSTDE